VLHNHSTNWFNLSFFCICFRTPANDFFNFINLIGRTQKAALHQVIEQILLDSVRFIFACASTDSLTMAISSTTTDEDVRLKTEILTKEIVIKHGTILKSKFSKAVFGLPCAMKILGFFVSTLQKHAAEIGQSVKSKIATARSPSPLADSSLDSDTIELLLSLKAIHAMLLAEGDMSRSRAVIMRYTSNFYYIFYTGC